MGNFRVGETHLLLFIIINNHLIVVLMVCVVKVFCMRKYCRIKLMLRSKETVVIDEKYYYTATGGR